jgi:type VI secretion system secreted protein Hcp
MAYHVFLKFEPAVKGESKTEGFQDQIELTHWNFGVSNGVHVQSGKTLQTETVSVDPITISKRNDSSTPALMKLVADGKTGKSVKATLTVCIMKNSKAVPSIIINLENVIVANVTMHGVGGGPLEDSATLYFTKVSYQYENLDAKGTSKTKPKFEYDLVAQTGQLA